MLVYEVIFAWTVESGEVVRQHKAFHTASLRLMVTSDREKNPTAKRRTRPNAHSKPRCTSPLTSERVRWTTGVRGIIQLRFCTISGKEERGKNTPLKKNIGVMNRVK